ncbi:hypothetical protein N7478_011029 [Penicillium angulare]|uniref:uncharacterized protein n=1 Tax=Penicillium angulare TaxID=116970 RepID=UPI00254187CE|nr:uncharacterized protein N7478_011029 [Penicillium angulare]KAJ5263424.1 hypothetical protein N7478_011029 [Penicillium angulare]
MTVNNAVYQPPEALVPQQGVSIERVEAMILKDMELDIPPTRDLGRFQKRCLSIIAHLWNAPSDENYFGTGVTGSSEAVMLGGLVMKRRWQLKNAARPGAPMNVVMGSNSHVCITRFAEFFGVEARVIPVDQQYTLDAKVLEEYLDQNTIGVFLTLGSTYSGHFDPVARVSNILDIYQHETGYDIPIHVDAAGGGFVAPFTLNNEKFVWDFRLPRVKSINASGHKYGLCPLAIGWVIWQDRSIIPPDLIHESCYLRGIQTAFSLSFSMSSTPIVYQYCNFLQKGLNGYRQTIQSCLENARIVSEGLESSGYFRCLSDIHRLQAGSKLQVGSRSLCEEEMISGLPVVVFRLSDGFKREYPSFCLTDISDIMHQQRYSIPYYTIPGWGPDGEDIEVMRIVVREDFTSKTAKEVLTGICGAVKNILDQ